MRTDQPWLLVLMTAAAVVVAKWWRDDYRALAAGVSVPHPMPGATPASTRACLIAVAGGLLLVALETGGEYALGISQEQSNVTVLLGIHTLAAAFLEELIFRGYVVVAGRGRVALWMSALAASIVFALLHPFLWRWEHSTMQFVATPKAWFSTAAIFCGSVWFYFVRFMPSNPQHSLLPCIAAHAAKNAAVFGIKLAQGHVVGWW